MLCFSAPCFKCKANLSRGGSGRVAGKSLWTRSQGKNASSMPAEAVCWRTKVASQSHTAAHATHQLSTSSPDGETAVLSAEGKRKKRNGKRERVTCVSAEPTYSWPEVEPPNFGDLQGILEALYRSDMYSVQAPASTRRTPKQPNKRHNIISRRAGTAGTGGSLSLKEWHSLLESSGIVPHHLSKVDAIHVFSSSRRSNLCMKYISEGSKMNELRVALRGLAERLSLPLGGMPLPVVTCVSLYVPLSVALMLFRTCEFAVMALCFLLPIPYLFQNSPSSIKRCPFAREGLLAF